MVTFPPSLVLWLKAVVVSLIAVFAPLGPMLLVVGCLVVADLVLGCLCAHKLKVPQKNSLKKSFIKLLIYQTALVLMYLCQTYLTKDLMPLVTLCAGAIGLVEALSIIESLNCLTGNTVFAALLAHMSPQGPQGPVGVAGIVGPVGLTGATGDQGSAGPVGPVGPVSGLGPANAEHIADNEARIAKVEKLVAGVMLKVDPTNKQ